MSKIALVTGCSRGLGLGLVKELLGNGYKVIATCRNPEGATKLNEVLEKGASEKLPVISCDTCTDESINKCREAVLAISDKIDLLINNAGMSNKDHPDDPPSKIDRQEFMDIMNVNVAGVGSMTQAFLPLLEKSANPKVINIGSLLGSTEKAAGINSTSYRCSKSALNMLTKVYSVEFPKIAFACVHPGWVQTDLGGAKNRKAPVTVEESCRGIMKVTEELTLENTGYFVSFTGEKLPY